MPNYLEKRMKMLGLTLEQAEVDLPNPNQKGKTYKAKLFSSDAHDNVDIHYYQLNGAPYVYEVEGSRNKQSFQRKRLKDPSGDAKYISPKGQGLLPFFPPAIIEKYQKSEPIDTLYLIEGEFKALAASLQGIDAVGLGGIHGFYGKRAEQYDPHYLNADIMQLLYRCQVKRICLLLDADTLTVNWKYNKDLYQRQHSFRTAVCNFYKVMHYCVDQDEYAVDGVFFGHLNIKFAKEAKGLDDLFLLKPKAIDKIKENLFGLDVDRGASDFFHFIKLDANYWTAIESYFGLENVDKFYKQYKDFIKMRQFVYRNAKYVATEDGEVKFIYHKDVEKFFRIGTDWMKIIHVPNKFDGVDEKIVPFSISEINRDYPQNKFPGFASHVKRYDSYCNVPDWTKNYNREHNGCYNLANPIEHSPKAGVCPKSFAFLKHIFSGDGNLVIAKREDLKDEELKDFAITDESAADYGTYRKVYEIDKERVIVESGKLGDQFTVGLDWLTIFHMFPKQMLPVPILVSKEYGTGKSTFFKWLKSIYGSNVAILNNEQFKMRFNAHYITKGLIIIDEGFLDVDKKAEKERLKQMVTSDTAYVEHKGVNLQEFPYYGKVMMGSNDADSVMKMDGDENRWFVVKVNPLKEADKDPDMEAKLRNEVSAWIWFLQKRAIQHLREQRLWFKEEYFITDQFKEIVKSTKSRIEHNIDELIKEYFLLYKQTELRVPRKWIVESLNNQSKYKTDATEVKRYLDKKLGYKLHDVMNVKYADGFGADDQITYCQTFKCRPYIFKIDDWLTEDDFDTAAEMEAFFKENNMRRNEDGELEKVVDLDEDGLPF